MADIKSGANPLFLREEELRQGMELLFFAYGLVITLLVHPRMEAGRQ